MVEYLIHEGHHLSTLLGLSVKQLDAFARLAADRRRDQVAQDAGIMRVAYHADQKMYKKFLEELDKDG